MFHEKVGSSFLHTFTTFWLDFEGRPLKTQHFFDVKNEKGNPNRCSRFEGAFWGNLWEPSGTLEGELRRLLSGGFWGLLWGHFWVHFWFFWGSCRVGTVLNMFDLCVCFAWICSLWDFLVVYCVFQPEAWSRLRCRRGRRPHRMHDALLKFFCLFHVLPLLGQFRWCWGCGLKVLVRRFSFLDYFKRASCSHAKTGFLAFPKQIRHAGKTHFLTRTSFLFF